MAVSNSLRSAGNRRHPAAHDHPVGTHRGSWRSVVALEARGSTSLFSRQPSQCQHPPIVVESFAELFEVDRRESARRSGWSCTRHNHLRGSPARSRDRRPRHSSARTSGTSCQTAWPLCTCRFRMSSDCRRCRTPIARRRVEQLDGRLIVQIPVSHVQGFGQAQMRVLRVGTGKRTGRGEERRTSRETPHDRPRHSRHSRSGHRQSAHHRCSSRRGANRPAGRVPAPRRTVSAMKWL